MVPVRWDRATRAEGIRALVSLAAGDPTGCLEIAQTSLSGAETWRVPEARWAKLEALSALAEWDQVRDFLPEVGSVAGSFAVLGPARDRAEGMMLAATGDSVGGARLLEQALERFEALLVPFEAARTKEALARLAGPDEAKRLLEGTLETYRRLGARPGTERVAAELDARRLR